MMLTYRAIIRPLSATYSPWQADTLFGHFCWLMRYEEGEAALRTFLEHYRQGHPPLLCSNGFPGDWLPSPLLPPAAGMGQRPRWISLEEFNTLRRGESVAPAPHPRLTTERIRFKQPINRLTGTPVPPDATPGSGQRYSVAELGFVDQSGEHPEGRPVSVYVKTRDNFWGRRAAELFQHLSRSGYGAKKSAGYGHFTVEWAQFRGFDLDLPGANGFISLSHWTPARTDPTDGFYDRLVKYGRLGEELATAGHPFKFPLMMLTAGSAFYARHPIRDWYGRLVPGIAPADPRVVQYAYAFAVPACLPTVKE